MKNEVKLISIIIRTYNEEMYLDRLLSSINSQILESLKYEVVIVDSGSEDSTLEIAEKHKCRITHIKKEDFTFGRSLNVGCEFANGEVFVFISGHCIPVNSNWLSALVAPIVEGKSHYTYGKQIGTETTKFSEHQVFAKYYPNKNQVPQKGIFCNNANSALLKDCWEKYKYCEVLTGLEDMFLSKKMVESGYQIGYVSTAEVYHIHNETWSQVKIRYEREAIALQKIMPEVYISFFDFMLYFLRSIIHDLSIAFTESKLSRNIKGIFLFRFMQYWGSYVGNHEQKKLSAATKKKYFYPKG